MNDKLRFSVLTLLMMVGFPLMIVMAVMFWLADNSSPYHDYRNLYRKAWRSN